jgi:hypothetical protein
MINWLAPKAAFLPLIKKENSTVQLEDYFNFLAPNDIRIKSSRIGIETILYEYIYRERTPEEIPKI